MQLMMKIGKERRSSDKGKFFLSEIKRLNCIDGELYTTRLVVLYGPAIYEEYGRFGEW